MGRDGSGNERRATQSPELDYLRGMALVHLERWQEARDAFSAGLLKAPKDSRFLVERAGAEYRLKEFSSAKKDLLAALRLNPKDDYAEEFLGTIYLLEGNLEATLKHWNRIGKPRMARVALDPEPRLQAKRHHRRSLLRPTGLVGRRLAHNRRAAQELGRFLADTPGIDASWRK